MDQIVHDDDPVRRRQGPSFKQDPAPIVIQLIAHGACPGPRCSGRSPSDIPENRAGQHHQVVTTAGRVHPVVGPRQPETLDRHLIRSGVLDRVTATGRVPPIQHGMTSGTGRARVVMAFDFDARIVVGNRDVRREAVLAGIDQDRVPGPRS